MFLRVYREDLHGIQSSCLVIEEPELCNFPTFIFFIIKIPGGLKVCLGTFVSRTEQGT